VLQCLYGMARATGNRYDFMDGTSPGDVHGPRTVVTGSSLPCFDPGRPAALVWRLLFRSARPSIVLSMDGGRLDVSDASRGRAPPSS